MSETGRLRRPLLATFFLAVAFVLFGLASPAGASTSTDEHEFLRLLNQARTSAGMPALVSDPSLASTSRSWSGTMAANGKISHATNLGQIAESIEPAWRKIGENVGVGYDAKGLHDAFMNSPGHRDNIMGSGYNRVGIGVVHSDGKTWVTVRFLQGSTITGITGLEQPLPEINQRSIEHACSTVQATATFADTGGNTHAPSITCLVGWGIASGKTSTTYEPNAPVTRQQLAAFVRNMLQEAGITLPATPANHFDDDDQSVHQLAIDQLAELGVVTGKSHRSFKPAAYVSRAEMTTFLVRAHKVAARLHPHRRSPLLQRHRRQRPRSQHQPGRRTPASPPASVLGASVRRVGSPGPRWPPSSAAPSTCWSTPARSPPRRPRRRRLSRCERPSPVRCGAQPPNPAAPRCRRRRRTAPSP